MRTARPRICGIGALLVALMVGSGCTHHHYYGTAPVCGVPASAGRVVNAPVVAGDYCDVPATSGQPVVVQTQPGRANTIITNQRPPAVVTSQPSRGAGGWRNKRDSGGATTRLSGTLDDDTLSR